MAYGNWSCWDEGRTLSFPVCFVKCQLIWVKEKGMVSQTFFLYTRKVWCLQCQQKTALTLKTLVLNFSLWNGKLSPRKPKAPWQNSAPELVFDSSLEVLQVAAHKGWANNTPRQNGLHLEAHTAVLPQENSKVFQKVQVFPWNTSTVLEQAGIATASTCCTHCPTHT